MRLKVDKSYQPILVENWPHKAHVIHVRPDTIRIVTNENIARLQVARSVLLNHIAHRVGHRAKEECQAIANGWHGIVVLRRAGNGGCEIVPITQDDGKRIGQQPTRHMLHDVAKPVGKHRGCKFITLVARAEIFIAQVFYQQIIADYLMHHRLCLLFNMWGRLNSSHCCPVAVLPLKFNHDLAPFADGRGLTAYNVRGGEWFANNGRPPNHIALLQFFSLVLGDLCFSIFQVVQRDDPFGLQGAWLPCGQMWIADFPGGYDDLNPICYALNGNHFKAVARALLVDIMKVFNERADGFLGDLARRYLDEWRFPGLPVQAPVERAPYDDVLLISRNAREQLFLHRAIDSGDTFGDAAHEQQVGAAVV